LDELQILQREEYSKSDDLNNEIIQNGSSSTESDGGK
jgi:hypothetical protein